MVHQSIDLWEGAAYDEGPVPGFRPRLEAWVLAGAKVRPAVLILPGGGYQRTSDREAEPVALRFAAAGFHAFVLRYSTAPHRHPQPLEDARRALAHLRSRAGEWNLNPAQVAVLGFSAGGHLAASLALLGGPKPGALVLAYPVITSGPFAHRGSFEALLGPGSEGPDRALLSLEDRVGPDTPPTFLWHTVADASVPVENSLLFAGALRRAGISFEMHLFPEGRHGLALADAETAERPGDILPRQARWVELCVEWLRSLW